MYQLKEYLTHVFGDVGILADDFAYANNKRQCLLDELKEFYRSCISTK